MAIKSFSAAGWKQDLATTLKSVLEYSRKGVFVLLEFGNQPKAALYLSDEELGTIVLPFSV